MPEQEIEVKVSSKTLRIEFDYLKDKNNLDNLYYEIVKEIQNKNPSIAIKDILKLVGMKSTKYYTIEKSLSVIKETSTDVITFSDTKEDDCHLLKYK